MNFQTHIRLVESDGQAMVLVGSKEGVPIQPINPERLIMLRTEAAKKNLTLDLVFGLMRGDSLDNSLLPVVATQEELSALYVFEVTIAGVMTAREEGRSWVLPDETLSALKTINLLSQSSDLT